MNRAVLVSVLLVSLTGFAAAGTVVTADEVAVLAERAIEDVSAREELGGITEVDGVPVDLGPLLDGSEQEVRERLRTLANRGEGPIDVSGASEDAGEILSESRFSDVKRASGDSPTGRATGWLVDRIPAPIRSMLGSWEFWVIVGLVIVALALAKTQWSRRPSRRDSAWDSGPGRPAVSTPTDFERMADQAEESGDYGAAVRLRFSAGLARLKALGAIDDVRTTSAGRLRRVVPVPAVDRLAGTFEWVVYGERPATLADVEETRSDWTTVLQAARGADA